MANDPRKPRKLKSIWYYVYVYVFKRGGRGLTESGMFTMHNTPYYLLLIIIETDVLRLLYCVICGTLKSSLKAKGFPT